MDTVMDDLQRYVETSYEENIMEILNSQDPRKHYAIFIDSMSLFAECVMFAHHLFESPLKSLELLNEAFRKATSNIWKAKLDSYIKISTANLHARLTALPNLPEIYRLVFPSCSDVGQFMCLCGTVIRITASKMIEFRKIWKCNKCKHTFTIDAEVDQGYVCEQPIICPNPELCSGKNFTLLSRDVDPAFCKDYQEIKIQEQAYNLSIGSVPRSMWLILEDDLVDTCQPGNDIIVSGVLIQRWKPLIKGKPIEIDLILLTQNVEVKNKKTPDVDSENLVGEFKQFWIQNQNDPLRGRDFILSSICPQIFGLYIVKLAVALILAGGTEKKDENTRIRGDSHLLLVGDPGTGKSQFLKFATKVSRRSVLTSGVGTTNAGLTVSAVKESGKWQLEAGALVLADGGICCIDEFSCIKEQDKTCIHEAMEQQTISVAKAGLVCSLSTRCSILAVTNPKGKYDKQMSLSENTALASPLLSRFDIILVLLDTHDQKWDDMVSSYILKGASVLDRNSDGSLWSIAKIKNYFTVIRLMKPKVTPACERVLQTYYKRQRSSQERNVARTTPRLLQSLIRLAEGHAKFMFRLEVLVIDAVVAILLMESSMSGSSIMEGFNTLHTSFPDDPKAEYEKRAESILNLLDLENLLEESNNYGISSEKMKATICIKDHKKDCFKQNNVSHLSLNSKCFDSNSVENKIEDCIDSVETCESENPSDILKLIMSSNQNNNKKEITKKDILKNQNFVCKNDFKAMNDKLTTLPNLSEFFSDNLVTEDATQNFKEIFKKGKLKSDGYSNNLIKNKQTAVIDRTNNYSTSVVKSPLCKKLHLSESTNSNEIQSSQNNINNKPKKWNIDQNLDLIEGNIFKTSASNKIKPIMNTSKNLTDTISNENRTNERTQTPKITDNFSTNNTSQLNEKEFSNVGEILHSKGVNCKEKPKDRFEKYRRKPVNANNLKKAECQPGSSTSILMSQSNDFQLCENTTMHNKCSVSSFDNVRKMSTHSVLKRIFSSAVSDIDTDLMDVIE